MALHAIIAFTIICVNAISLFITGQLSLLRQKKKSVIFEYVLSYDAMP